MLVLLKERSSSLDIVGMVKMSRAICKRRRKALFIEG